ncbi:hypothetical protein [Caballeronia hypogeia]|uniref:hypothetical protein n=1 Tax=Caballeronia hypogeia TaxID=1777140 RepID=UPI0018DFA2A1
MFDVVAFDTFEFAHGVFPIAFDRRRHCRTHLGPDMHGPVYAIADGEVVAYRVCQHGIDSGDSNAGFVLLKHSTETGAGRALTFYSLYMHLRRLDRSSGFFTRSRSFGTSEDAGGSAWTKRLDASVGRSGKTERKLWRYRTPQ